MLRTPLTALLLALLSFYAYLPVLDNDFIFWDTQDYVINNPHIRALTWENLSWMLTALYAANWHPLTWLSHAIDYQLYELQPWGHHLSNLLLHSANTVWVFLLGLRLGHLLCVPSAKPNPSTLTQTNVFWAASFAALLFGLHPQHVESVAWVAERKDVLSLFFILPTLLAYLRYGETGQWRWYFLTLLGLLLALLSKPMAVTLPALLLVLDLYPLRRLNGWDIFKLRRRLWQRLLEKLPFFLASAGVIALTLLAQDSAMTSLHQLGLETRLLNAFHSLLFYIQKFLLPVPLLPFYPYPDFTGWQAWTPVLAVFALSALCVYAWHRQQPWWLAGWLFYLISLAPVLGIIQVGLQAAADRYAYLPTVPFYLGLGFGALYLGQRWRRWVPPVAALLLGSSLMLLTQQQTRLWRNGLTLWHYSVAYTPDSAVSHGNLCVAYALLQHWDKAIQHCNFSLMLMPVLDNYYQLATVYRLAHRYDDALRTYQVLLNSHQFDQDATQMGLIYSSQAQVFYDKRDFAQAQALADQALRSDPQQPLAQALLTQLARENALSP